MRFASGFLVLSGLLAAVVVGSGAAHAASATWNGTSDSLWATEGNWSAAPAPGTGDTATFNNAGNGNTNIDLGVGVTNNTILFDTADAVAYAIGTGAAGSQALALDSGGAVAMSAAVTNNQVINAAITLGADATDGTNTFSQLSARRTLTLAGTIAGGAGGAAGSKTLNVTNDGTLIINGVIANGGAASLQLVKTGGGLLTLGAANTFTGGCIFDGGTNYLKGGEAALGAYPASFQSNNITLLNGAKLGKFTGGDAGFTISANRGIYLGPGRHAIGKDWSGNSQVTINSVISGPGALDVVSGWRFNINAANTFSGDTRIIQGVASPQRQTMVNHPLSLQNSTVDISTTNASPDGYSNVGTLYFGGYASNPGAIFVLGGLKGTIAMPLPSNGTAGELRIGNNNQSTTYSGVLSGGGSDGVTKIGTGRLTMPGNASTFTGRMAIRSGAVAVNSINNASATGPLGSNANAVVLGYTGGLTGTVEVIGTNAAYSSNKKFTLVAGGVGAFQIDNAGTAHTLSGVIDGGGALVKAGPGTLVLTAENSYSGATVVNGGILSAGVSNGLPSGTVLRINGSGQMSNTADQVVSRLYFGDAQQAPGTWGSPESAAANQSSRFLGTNLVVVTAEEWIFNGDALNVTGGAADLTASLNATSAAVEVLAYWGTEDGTNNAAGLWQNTNSLGWFTNASVTVTNRATNLKGNTKYWWTFRVTNESTNYWASPSLCFQTTVTGMTWTGESDSQWLAASNWSGLSVPGTNDMALFVSGGNGHTILDLGSGGTVGGILFDTAAAAAYVIGSGATGSQTLTLNSGGAVTMNDTVGGDQSINASVVLGADAAAGTNTFTQWSIGGTLRFAGAIAGGSGGTAGAKTLSVVNDGPIVVTGAIGNGGASSLQLVKTGAGVLTLSVANSFRGGLVVSGGTLCMAGGEDALGAYPATFQSNNVTLLNGARLGTFSLPSDAGPAWTIRANRGIYLGPGQQAIGKEPSGNPFLAINSVISGPGGLDAYLGYYIDLKANNTYTGDTRIFTCADSGRGLRLNNSLNLQNSTLDYNSYGGYLQYTYGSNAGAVFTLGGLKGNQNLALPVSGAVGGLMIGNNNQSTTYSGAMSGTGINGVTKIGTGTLTLSGTSTFTGQMTVRSGEVAVPSINNIAASGPLGSGSTPVTLGSGGGVTGSLAVIGTNVAYSADKTFTLASGGTGAFRIANTNTTQTLSGVIDGSGTFLKTGPGTLVLGGANTYTGDTRVEEGTLQLDQAKLCDIADVYVSAGAVINANFTGKDLVHALYLGGARQPPGWYGADGAGSPFIVGVGTIVVEKGTVIIVR